MAGMVCLHGGNGLLTWREWFACIVTGVCLHDRNGLHSTTVEGIVWRPWIEGKGGNGWFVMSVFFVLGWRLFMIGLCMTGVK
jgi:hypothetical protein